MVTAAAIKILVFSVAGLIVLIFLLSGVHIVRAIHLHQQQAVARRTLGVSVLQTEGSPVVIPDIIKRDGFIIVQPDGLRDLALRIESADERAYKAMAEKALIEARAQEELNLARSSRSTNSSATSSSRCQTATQSSDDESHHAVHDEPLPSSSPSTFVATVEGTRPQEPDELSDARAGPPSVASSEPIESPNLRHQAVVQSQNLSSSPQPDVESQSLPPQSRGTRMLKTLKRWFTSTDSF